MKVSVKRPPKAARTKKVSRKKPITPRSQIKAALRLMWMLSRERAAALQRENNTCECCGAKASVAKGREVKVEVHHNSGQIPWNPLIDYIMRHLIVDPSQLTVMCKKCHVEAHATGEF